MGSVFVKLNLNLVVKFVALSTILLFQMGCLSGTELIILPSEGSGYQWKSSSWGACSTLSCGVSGTQARTVQCEDSDGNIVDDSNCTGTRPQDSQVCSGECSTCSIPVSLGGGTLTHNSSVTAFQASSVAFGQSCQSEQRTCNDGTLSGSYTHSSCSVASPTSCTLDGVTVNHGDSHTFYSSNSVACGQSCQSISRTCNNGTLSGDNAYDKASCSVASCNSCTSPWSATVNHGDSVTAYQAATVAFGQTCQSEQRTCTDGTLDGTYTHQSCSVTDAASCTLDGVTVDHGDSHTFYNSNSVACGQSCQSVSRTCNNGTLSGDNSYDKASCSVASCNSCTSPWSTTVNHGDAITAYLTATVPSGQTCQSEQRSCSDGTLSGTYTHQSCSVLAGAPLENVSFAFDQYLEADGARYFALLMADFTGDGNLDVIFGDHIDGEDNKYWSGDGTGDFTLLDNSTYGSGLTSPERGSLWAFLLDFDFDGDLDWFWDDVSPASLRINNGSGVFSSHYSDTGSDRIVGFSQYQSNPVMAVVTTTGRIIDGQAILDGAFNNIQSNSPYILGQAACSAPVGFNEGIPICQADLGDSESDDFIRNQSWAYVDLDNDSDKDMVVSYGEPWAAGVTKIYRNDGGGNYTDMGDLPHTLVGAFINYAVITYGDINNDGLMDLIIPGTVGGYRVYVNEGGFTFTNVVTFNDDPQADSHWGQPAVAVGDYDNDGKADIGLINGPRVKLYRNTSN